MSARRLATVQPESFALSTKAKKEIGAWVKKYPKERQRSALIPALWIAQKDAGGWLPEAALRELGDMLDMAYIRVYEVATFYTMFNLEPVGEHHIQLCGTTPCWLRGAGELKKVCERKIGKKGSTSADGKLSWVEVECLGACANAPMIQVSNAAGDDYYEDLTPESFEMLLDDLAAGNPVKAGPQNTRHTSEPEGGVTTLNSKGLYAKQKVINLPNCDKKTRLNYYEWDPKERRATKGGWVDPKKKASRDPKKRKDNMGEDLSKGIVEETPNAALPERSSKSASKKVQVLYTDGPTDGQPDDLKIIKGVGPVFEGVLNDNGIYYYRQIGAWKAKDIKMIDGLLGKFSGRIERDGWVKQAKALAKGKKG